MDTKQFLDRLLSLADYEKQAVHVERIGRREAVPGALDRPLPTSLAERLEAAGIIRLYSHQAEALNLARSGRNVMVATPSSSGKSLCYNVPVLEALLTDRHARALYLFPTKALAQDQLRHLQALAVPDLLGPDECATFDGDTPGEERASVKKQARIVLSNPDMLHVGVLPNHQSWMKFLRHLEYVVVDEAHVYRGVFGSHVAHVLRRLRRVCDLYGATPRFVCCSATVANPAEHASALTGLPFETIVRDGSPHGDRVFVFWNPPLMDPAKTARRSPNSEASSLFAELTKAGLRTLVFARTRKLAELIYRYARDRLPRHLADRISPYRAGYLPEDRRNIEQRLFDGQLLGAVATTALELGVDIGDLDATVLTGYPGSIASTWQQAGRSGRGQHESLTFLVAQNSPLDQYLTRHPEFLFGSRFENALINPCNPHIARPHLLAAAWEIPLSAADAALFGECLEPSVRQLEEEARLRRRERRWYPAPSVTYPAQDVDIRSPGAGDYIIVDASQGYRLLETVSSSAALSQLHAGAVYFHQGDAYLVTRLDLDSRTAVAEPTDVPYYTVAKEITDIRVLKTRTSKMQAGTAVHLGELEVTTEVVGFKKKRQYTEDVVEELALDLPLQRFVTEGLWFDLPEAGADEVEAHGLDFAGGIHALEHAAIGLLPLFALCDRNDIGGVSTPLHIDTGRPQVFIYDAYPGGIGIAETGYALIVPLWNATLTAILECPCQEGCPACVQSPKCGNNNEPLDKMAAAALLRALTGRREAAHSPGSSG